MMKVKLARFILIVLFVSPFSISDLCSEEPHKSKWDIQFGYIKVQEGMLYSS